MRQHFSLHIAAAEVSQPECRNMIDGLAPSTALRYLSTQLILCIVGWGFDKHLPSSMLRLSWGPGQAELCSLRDAAQL